MERKKWKEGKSIVVLLSLKQHDCKAQSSAISQCRGSGIFSKEEDARIDGVRCSNELYF